MHLVTRTSGRWLHGMATDSTFSGLVFPEHSDPIQVDDACLGELYGITVQSGRSVPHGLTVEDYHETPWFRDSVGYILMYDHRDRYIMTDRDPTILSDRRIVSGPTGLLNALNGPGAHGPVVHRVRIDSTFQ